MTRSATRTAMCVSAAILVTLAMAACDRDKSSEVRSEPVVPERPKVALVNDQVAGSATPLGPKDDVPQYDPDAAAALLIRPPASASPSARAAQPKADPDAPVIAAAQSQAVTCFGAATSGTKRNASIHVIVGPTGRVTRAEVSDPSGGDEETSCLKGVGTSLTFSQLSGNKTDIREFSIDVEAVAP